ncbi:flagellar basal body rod protein FlgC [Novosphingobium sp.]|uniref:flagellar basal body rod protein FlgC n=1 Tax=Novosphingobium sp. TaxID=1874826 RepID=UPI0035B3BDA5
MGVDPISISRSALDVEWQRLNIVAMNLANENTATVAGKAGYRPLTLISGPQGDFASAMKQGSHAPTPQGVRVIAVEARANPTRLVYDPRHPAADANGFVAYPNIDHAEEMVTLMRTARAYESNLTALSLSQQMAMRALDIGRR